MPLPDADKKSPRVYTLLQNLDLENVTAANLSDVADTISIEEANEDELRRICLVAFARMVTKGSFDGWLSGASGIGGSITDNQIAFGASTADEIEGEAQLTWDSANDALVVGLGAGYPRLWLQGTNGFIYFKDTTEPTAATKGAFGMSGSTMYFKQTSGETTVFQIHSSGAWGLMGSNYGTDGQVLTSQGAGVGVNWEDAALSTSAHETPPSAADDDGTKGQLAFDDDYFYVCIDTDTWKRTALSSW